MVGWCPGGHGVSLLVQVLELMELMPLRNAYTGLPGLSGLSVEQRKRLTIGVELVANPSIIFMDVRPSSLSAVSTLGGSAPHGALPPGPLLREDGGFEGFAEI